MKRSQTENAAGVIDFEMECSIRRLNQIMRSYCTADYLCGLERILRKQYGLVETRAKEDRIAAIDKLLERLNIEALEAMESELIQQ